MSTTPTITLTSTKGRPPVVSTFLSDDEAASFIAAEPKSSSFAKDLSTKVLNGKSISSEQVYWLHKLAMELTTFEKKKDATAIEADSFDYGPLVAKFATTGKSKPAILIPYSAFGTVLEIKKAGKTSKYAGALMLSDGEPFGTTGARWYGYISSDGKWCKSKHVTPEVEELVKKLVTDFHGVVSTTGKAVHWCCFCGEALTDPNSVDAGYGPVCAKRWGLPHKGVSTKSKTSASKTVQGVIAKSKAHTSSPSLLDVFMPSLTKTAEQVVLDIPDLPSGMIPLDTAKALPKLSQEAYAEKLAALPEDDSALF